MRLLLAVAVAERLTLLTADEALIALAEGRSPLPVQSVSARVSRFRRIPTRRPRMRLARHRLLTDYLMGLTPAEFEA